MNYGPGTTAATSASVVVAIATIIMITRVIICYRRKKNEEEFGSEILVDERPPNKWHSIKRNNVGPGSLESLQGNIEVHLGVHENMEENTHTNTEDIELLSPSQSESVGSMRCGAMVRGEALKPLKTDVSETDVCNPDGRAHENSEPEKMEDSVTMDDQDIHLPHP